MYIHLYKGKFVEEESVVSNMCYSLTDMTRQYKTMQTEMGLRIHQLETELGRTRTQLSESGQDIYILS